jgi:hypothetical protein
LARGIRKFVSGDKGSQFPHGVWQLWFWGSWMLELYWKRDKKVHYLRVRKLAIPSFGATKNVGHKPGIANFTNLNNNIFSTMICTVLSRVKYNSKGRITGILLFSLRKVIRSGQSHLK